MAIPPCSASCCLQGLPCLLTGDTPFPPQIRDISRLSAEERIDFLTRMSPPPPDARTLAYAAGALLAAAVVYLLLRRWRRIRPPEALYHAVLQVLFVASLLWFGTFMVKGVILSLFKPPFSFTREAYPFVRPSAMERFLHDVCAKVPENAGVMLLNCRDPIQTSMSNYFLFPRRVIFTRHSVISIPDPRAFLDEETVKALRARGVDWLLDLDPRSLARGPGVALIPLPRTERSRERDTR